MRDYAGAVVLLKEAPEFDFDVEDMVFTVAIRIGTEELVVGLRPHLYFKAVARSVEASRQFRIGGDCEVVPFPEQISISGH